MHLLSKSLTGKEAARELLSVLSGVASNCVLAVMHDCAAVNAVAVRTLKSSTQVLLTLVAIHTPLIMLATS